MPGFRVTPRARDDVKSIGRYTQQQWGKAQRNVYLLDLEKRFHWLAEHPQFGKHRTDVADGYFSFPQGQHVIFYLIGKEGIEIVGGVHKAMDIVAYFLPD